MKKISIITPSLNQAAFIRDAIESVLVQNDPCFEHIVVDGGSTDGTIKILKQYKHLKWISGPDKNQSDAVNKGVRMAEGEIIGEINADDFYLPGAFAEVRRIMEAPNSKRVCVGACETRRDNTRIRIWSPEKVTFKSVLRFPVNLIPHPSLFFTKEIYQEAGGMDDGIKFGPDVDLLLKLSKITDFDTTPTILAVNRFHAEALQEKYWDRNFTAALYHIAKYGDFENFHEMYLATYDSFRPNVKNELIVPLLEKYVKAQWAALRYCGDSSHRMKLVIFGAGNHTIWLEGVVGNIKGPEVAAVIDDRPPQRSCFGLTPVKPEDMAGLKYDAILLSSDTVADKFRKRCIQLFGNDIRLIGLYEGLPPGPYRK